MKMLDCEENECFQLYHSVGLYAMHVTKKDRNAMLETVRKHGLMSTSTIGRRIDDEYGRIIALTGERVWFSRKLGCEFTKLSDPLVLRVTFEEDEFEEEFGRLHDDDQFFSKDRCEVFIESDGEFSIPPWRIEYWDGKDWIPVAGYDPKWRQPTRKLQERLQPMIKEDFERLGLSPSSDADIKRYVYVESTRGVSGMTREEFRRISGDEREEIDRFVVFDWEIRRDRDSNHGN